MYLTQGSRVGLGSLLVAGGIQTDGLEVGWAFGVVGHFPYIKTSQRKVRSTVSSGPPRKTRTSQQYRIPNEETECTSKNSAILLSVYREHFQCEHPRQYRTANYAR